MPLISSQVTTRRPKKETDADPVGEMRLPVGLSRGCARLLPNKLSEATGTLFGTKAAKAKDVSTEDTETQRAQRRPEGAEEARRRSPPVSTLLSDSVPSVS